MSSETLSDVEYERHRQDIKWGEQNHQDYATQIGFATRPAELKSLYSGYAAMHKRINDERAKQGDIAWDSILLEEVYEALELIFDGNVTDLRAELIQVAAVAVAWVEALDRRAP